MAKKVKFLDHKQGIKNAGRCGVDVSVGVAKELSSIVAFGCREVTGTKKRKGKFKSNVATKWFE